MRQNDAGGKGGRPAQGPKTGKASAFATRITPATRALLDAEAEATGQSISQIAEQWLEAASQAKALGGPIVGDAVLTLAGLAQSVEAATGAHPSVNAASRSALLTAWEAALPHVLRGAPDSAAGVARRMARVEALFQARRVLEELDRLPDDFPFEEDPTISELAAPISSSKMNVLHWSHALPARSEPWSLFQAIRFVADGDGLRHQPVLMLVESELPRAIDVAGWLTADLQALSEAIARYRAADTEYSVEMRRAEAIGRELGQALAASSGHAPD